MQELALVFDADLTEVRMAIVFIESTSSQLVSNNLRFHVRLYGSTKYFDYNKIEYDVEYVPKLPLPCSF